MRDDERLEEAGGWTGDGKLHDECGVFGACLHDNAALAVYYGLVSLQHRGQESAGIATCFGGEVRVVKGMGLVGEVFHEGSLERLPGGTGIGHVRYAITGDGGESGIQPFVFRHLGGMMAVAMNGHITNGPELRLRLARSGVVFQSESDSETIGCLIARYHSFGMVGAIERTMEDLRGGYSFVVMADDTVYAVRDPYGFRPLIMGTSPSGWAVASESCALDAISASGKQDIGRGEIVAITRDGVRAVATRASKRGAPPSTCIFEYIYFARPDSVIDGIGVGAAREAVGAALARESGISADVVVPVPESGVGAALGYSAESKIPFQHGLTKNRYLGRTFIRPSQSERELGVRLKLNAVEHSCAGKRVVLVDDSIVRGTTSARLVDLMRKAGAKEVHLAVSSPPVLYPCCYGIDTKERTELIAVEKSVEEIRETIEADSLTYISRDGMLDAVSRLAPGGGFCTACFDGCYPEVAPGSGTCGCGRMTYRESGVDIAEGDRAVALMKPAVRSTFTPGVMSDIGGFGGLFSLAAAGIEDPVLISGADGVGTKLKIAFAMERDDTIGIDAVAMCVNDVLVSGAKPLFFLDYIGCGRLDAERIAQVVSGVADGCRQAGCALVGGETAEMPGFYPDGEYDIAGFAVGAVDRSKLIDGSRIRPGDAVIGVNSSGLHSNGYSLARAVLLEAGGMLLTENVDELGCTLGEELLRPTKIYAAAVASMLEKVDVLGMAHITGGGLVENPPRILPEGASMELDLSSWRVHPIFRLIQRTGKVDIHEMLRVFNMGIGLVAVVHAEDADLAVRTIGEHGEAAQVIGRIVAGDKKVKFRGCEDCGW
ncbi:MAG: amidophosphoribosyltransferase [Clostridia bacterium]|nr:amidophosphoribosyltransferase [Clostridia bacterium]